MISASHIGFHIAFKPLPIPELVVPGSSWH
jgi:hypothetical protein